MSADPVEAIANAVLYEGYLLYPYRLSAVKNQVRWTIGGIHPRDSGEPWTVQAECLVTGDDPAVDVELRFLQPLAQPLERRVPCPAGQQPLSEWGIEGLSEVTLLLLERGVRRLTVRVCNTTPLKAGASRDDYLPTTMASAHLVLRARGGCFVSLVDPPAHLQEAVDACRQDGLWPVLVGSPETRDTVLASPIILDEFPRIAEESPGDLFDGTEIDEILTLRILTLTDAEKEEIRNSDPRARAILERSESLTEDEMMSLHGKLRR